jgi:hypothetical protein
VAKNPSVADGARAQTALFSWSPDPARIVRFDDREAAEAELTRVQSFAANARLREVP